MLDFWHGILPSLSSLALHPSPFGDLIDSLQKDIDWIDLLVFYYAMDLTLTVEEQIFSIFITLVIY